MWPEAVKTSRILKKTQVNTLWATNFGKNGLVLALRIFHQISETVHALDNVVVKMELPADVSFWLQGSVLEVRKSNGDVYSPDSLYQLCCGIQRALREAGHDVNIFEQFQFAQCRSVIDGALECYRKLHRKKES